MKDDEENAKEENEENEDDEDTILIEFIYSDTCPDCPPAKEAVERVVPDYDRVEVEYLQVKDNPGKISKHDITHVPTIVIDGDVEFVETLTEAKLRATLEEKLDE